MRISLRPAAVFKWIVLWVDHVEFTHQCEELTGSTPADVKARHKDSGRKKTNKNKCRVINCSTAYNGGCGELDWSILVWWTTVSLCSWDCGDRWSEDRSVERICERVEGPQSQLPMKEWGRMEKRLLCCVTTAAAEDIFFSGEEKHGSEATQTSVARSTRDFFGWLLVIGKSSRCCTYTLFLSQGRRKWTYFCSRGSGFWDTGRFSKLPYLGIELGPWQKLQKLHIHILSTPGCRNWAYFRSTDNGFRFTGQFIELPYLGIELGHRLKLQKLRILSLSTPGGRHWPNFLSTASGLRDTGQFSKLPYLGMKLKHWEKFQMLHTDCLSTRGSEWSLFSLYGQRFARYRPIFKIAIFGHETCSLGKVPDVAHTLSSHPKGSKFSLFSLYSQRLPSQSNLNH